MSENNKILNSSKLAVANITLYMDKERKHQVKCTVIIRSDKITPEEVNEKLKNGKQSPYFLVCTEEQFKEIFLNTNE